MLLADLKPDSSSSPFHSRIPGEDGAAAVRMCRMYYDRYTWILDWSNSQGKTALHIAALKGNEELVRVRQLQIVDCAISGTRSERNYRCCATSAQISIWLIIRGIHRYTSELFRRFSSGSDICNCSASSWGHISVSTNLESVPAR